MSCGRPLLVVDQPSIAITRNREQRRDFASERPAAMDHHDDPMRAIFVRQPQIGKLTRRIAIMNALRRNRPLTREQIGVVDLARDYGR